MQNKFIPNRPSIVEETFDFTDADYKPAIQKLYREWRSEYDNLGHQYKDWSQTAQVYSYNRYDGYGNQIVANVKAYNETIIERKRLAIMMKLIEQQVSLLESYWVSKGYDLDELRTSLKTKQLQKLRTTEYVKKEEPVAEVEPNDNVKPVKTKTLTPIDNGVEDVAVDENGANDVVKDDIETDIVDADDIDVSEDIANDETLDETETTDAENIEAVEEESIDDTDDSEDPDDREDVF